MNGGPIRITSTKYKCNPPESSSYAKGITIGTSFLQFSDLHLEIRDFGPGFMYINYHTMLDFSVCTILKNRHFPGYRRRKYRYWSQTIKLRYSWVFLCIVQFSLSKTVRKSLLWWHTMVISISLIRTRKSRLLLSVVVDAVDDIPGVRFKVVKVASCLGLYKEKKEKPRNWSACFWKIECGFRRIYLVVTIDLDCTRISLEVWEIAPAISQEVPLQEDHRAQEVC